MNAAIQSLQSPFAQRELQTRLSRQFDFKKLFAAIDRDPALIGAGVVYIDSQNTTVTLREFTPICSIKPVKVILREPPRATPTLEFVADLKTKRRESTIVMEAVNTGLSCGAAIIGWVVVISSAGAVPLTGGTSGIFTVLSYSAATASTLQCFNSAGRTYLEATSPQRVDWLNSQEWYVNATIALDVISLGGAAAAGLLTVRAIKLLTVQGVPIRQALQGLNRAQRKRLTQEIIRANQPGISNRMMKLAQRLGEVPSRYSSRQISSALVRQLRDALGATLSLTGSATSGSIHNLAIGIYEEVE